MALQEIQDTIVNFIRSQVNQRKSEGVVLGLSGGLDSAVAAALSVKALGPEYVFALILPESKVTPKYDIKHAMDLAKILNINYKIIEIGKAKNTFIQDLPVNRLAQGNLASRLRMCIIYYYASVMHRLVVGTSDKSELILGYFSKYGDGASDIMPIADLYKTEVRKLGDHLGIPHDILKKKSSPRLWKNQTAEGEIGMSYEKIDLVLKQLEGGSSHQHRTQNNKVQVDKKTLEKIKILIEKNKHKRELAPICVINEK